MESDVTVLLRACFEGEVGASDRLLATVYSELRGMAVSQLRREQDCGDFSPTVLVHEVFLKLWPDGIAGNWENRRHFFAAAAKAMRRILVDQARRRLSQKHGNGKVLTGQAIPEAALPEPDEQLILLHEALEEFSREEPEKAELVQLRYFAGLTEQEAAQALGVSRPTASRYWTFARAWLHARINSDFAEEISVGL